MIEYMEAELIGAPKETSIANNMTVAEEANVDESITAEAKAINDMENYLKEERNTKSYEDKWTLILKIATQ